MSATDSKVTSLGDAPAAAAVAASKVEAKPTKLVGKSAGDGELSGKRSTIKIYAKEEEGGNHAVFVSLNGIGYHIPRDVPVDVPVELIEVLNNAVTTITNPAAQGGGVTTRDVPRFQFQVLNQNA